MQIFKTVIALLFLLFTSVIYAEVVLYPKGADAVAVLEFEKIRKNSKINELDSLTDLSMLSKIKKEYNFEQLLKTEEVQTIMFHDFFRERVSFILIKTPVNELEFLSRINTLKGVLKTDKYYQITLNNKRFICKYLSKDTILFVKQSDYNNYLRLKSSTNTQFSKLPLLNKKESVAFGKFTDVYENKYSALMFMHGIKATSWVISFVGINSKDIKFEAVGLCKSNKSANTIRGNIMAYLALGGMMFFKDDPNLGSELISRIKIKSKDVNLYCVINLTEDLQTRLIKYIERKLKYYKSKKYEKQSP